MFVFEVAKRIIEKDGYHRPIVLYFTEDGKYAVNGFDMADRAEILVAWRVIAANVRKMRADSGPGSSGTRSTPSTWSQ